MRLDSSSTSQIFVFFTVCETNPQFKGISNIESVRLGHDKGSRFGQSSEKLTYVMKDSHQLGLFNEAEAEQDPKVAGPTEETLVKDHTRKPKHTIDKLTDGLPVEKILLNLSEEEQICVPVGAS